MLSLDSRNVQLRNRVFVALLLALATLTATAQYSRGRTKKTSPRALGLVQVLPTGKARLIPISIFLDGKYFDARYYMAKPVPLALYDDTVYIALEDGMPAGNYTVHSARIGKDVIWGEGDWSPHRSTTADSGKDSAKPDSDRPVLKKPGDAPVASAESKPAVKADSDSDRPVLRKPKTGEAPTQQVQITTAEMSPAMPPEDPNRPVFTRKAQPSRKAEEPETLVEPKRGIPGARYIVAISDPDPMDTRPYDYPWSESEKGRFTAELEKMAMAAVRKYASGPVTRVQLAPSAKFTDVQVKAFDIDFSNAPYLIFTGRIDPTLQPATGAKQPTDAPKLATLYATVVARVSSSGELNALMTSATDSAHLDLTPRYEFIDAVDTDGDNRAELLFRKVTDTGGGYVIYQMTPFQMTEVFDGGSGL